MLHHSSVLFMCGVAVLIVAGLGLLLTPAAATTMDASTYIGELDKRSLIAPTFDPRAISESEAEALEVCSTSSVTPNGLTRDEECHDYSKEKNGQCCSTVQNIVCCGDWCH
jgi:hypothetical protein